MLQEALAMLFYQELNKCILADPIYPEDQLNRRYKLFKLLINEATQEERIQFSTLFTRLAYLGHRYTLSEELMYYLHFFRNQMRLSNANQAEPTAVTIELGSLVIAHTIREISGLAIPESLHARLPDAWPVPYMKAGSAITYSKLRVVALADDAPNNQLLVTAEEFLGQQVRVQYNILDRNMLFNNSIQIIQRVFGFPVTLNLLQVEIDDAGILRPEAIVIEPDFLTDISTIAIKFKLKPEFRPWSYLLDKFKPSAVSTHILLGHIANHFLDELMSNPEAVFEAVFPPVFAKYPLDFCLLKDDEIRELTRQSHFHFINLKQAVNGVLLEQGIHPQHCYLEPSFYADEYGIQGRLDVFCYQPGKESEAAIVELKSGKIYNANVYGINQDHFVQTLLYDMLISAVFNNKIEPACYILYSALADNNLRFAPRVRASQLEALMVRNQFIAIEWKLQQLSARGDKDLAEQGRALFGRLKLADFSGITGFEKIDLASFEKVFDAMTDLELRYFTAFAGFIAREHRLAKIGDTGLNNINGLASLWLNAEAEKKENFQLLGQLTFQSIKGSTLVLSRSEGTEKVANFRPGETAILYPERRDGAGVLGSQIFKGNIVSITSEEVVIQLRSPQFNDAIFKQFVHWNIEPDSPDMGFSAMYRSLFAFANSPKEKKQLILGISKPEYADPLQLPMADELTQEQHAIMCKALAAKDYFLLWGPPGTGKTSKMLKHLVLQLLKHPDENILLLAYTNRAVDEICESLDAIGGDIRSQYFRIGSKHATGAAFQGQLLDALLENISNRKDLMELIKRRRIVCATVSSLSFNVELLSLKSFSTVIIDEASQILEPNLVGLLPRFSRFILIGDHKQLPAVVQQDNDRSAVQDKALMDIGLHNLRNSLFERLFSFCISHNLDHAYARLSHQGRMHQDLMDFPNRHFYQGGLRILPEGTKGYVQQTAPIQAKPVDACPLSAILSSRRAVFLSTPTDEAGAAQKTNRHEAVLIADLVQAFQRMYADDVRSIGIITTFRAQIAMIKAELERRRLPLQEINIDTVERYQGGSRDVILMSVCVNSMFALNTVISLSDDGVDRKMNVALTRAREHLVMVGNADLLSQNESYSTFINNYSVNY